MNKNKLLERLETICENCADCWYSNKSNKYNCQEKIGVLISDIKMEKLNSPRRKKTPEVVVGAKKGKRLPDPFKKILPDPFKKMNLPTDTKKPMRRRIQ